MILLSPCKKSPLLKMAELKQRLLSPHESLSPTLTYAKGHYNLFSVKILKYPLDVGGTSCPSPAYDMDRPTGLTHCCCGQMCCWSGCKWSVPNSPFSQSQLPQTCLPPQAKWVLNSAGTAYQAIEDGKQWCRAKKSGLCLVW